MWVFFRNKGRVWLVALGVLGLFAGGAVAASQLTSSTDASTIYACKSANGALRIVDAGTACKNNETPLSWNVVGPAGPAGADGTNGTNGSDGADGQSVAVSVEPAGQNCPNGGVKLVSASGTNYVCNGAAGQDGQDGAAGAPGATSLSGLAGQPCSFGDVSGTYSVTLGNDDTVVIHCTPAGDGGGTTTTGPPPNGTPCDDGNPATVNDVYDNGVCTGLTVSPEICDGLDNDHDGVVDDNLVDTPPLPQATAYCFNGQWRIAACNPGYADVDGIVADGCEVNLNIDPENCGGVGILPPPDSVSHATYSCVNGHFVILACDQGYQDVDNSPADGCEFQSAARPTRAGPATGQA